MEVVWSRLALALLMLCPMVGLGQDTSVDGPPPPSSNTQQDQSSNPPQERPSGTLEVNVDVVNVFCNSKDKHGERIPDLKKDDFQLSVGGKPQAIKYFSADTEQ